MQPTVDKPLPSPPESVTRAYNLLKTIPPPPGKESLAQQVRQQFDSLNPVAKEHVSEKLFLLQCLAAGKPTYPELFESLTSSLRIKGISQTVSSDPSQGTHYIPENNSLSFAVLKNLFEIGKIQLIIDPGTSAKSNQLCLNAMLPLSPGEQKTEIRIELGSPNFSTQDLLWDNTATQEQISEDINTRINKSLEAPDCTVKGIYLIPPPELQNTNQTNSLNDLW